MRLRQYPICRSGGRTIAGRKAALQGFARDARLPDAALEPVSLIAEYHAIRRNLFQPESRHQ